MSLFLLEMAGKSGSGKSTLARAIGRETGAAVLDKDVIQAAALNADLERESAAGAAYEVAFDLARSLLGQGFSVILDSAAFFTSIREKGQAIARECVAAYFIIECRLDDAAEQERRLKNRPRQHRYQPVDIDAAGPDYSRPGTAELTGPHLSLDTSRPLGASLAAALAYLRNAQTSA